MSHLGPHRGPALLHHPSGHYLLHFGSAYEVHVNTMEGFWSLLRSWLRPHRGISQEKLLIDLDFFQFVHNARKMGKALLGALVSALVA